MVQMGLKCHHKCPHTRAAERELRHRWRGSWEAGGRVAEPGTACSHWELEESRADLPPEPPQGAQPRPHLDFTLATLTSHFRPPGP